MSKRHQVEYSKTGVDLDGEGYTLEGVGAETVWRLAYEGLVARLKRSSNPRETFVVISEGGLLRQKKAVDPWAAAFGEAAGLDQDRAIELWESFSREKKARLRQHPYVVAKYHKDPEPLDSFFEQDAG